MDGSRAIRFTLPCAAGPSKRNAAPFAQSENLVDVDYTTSFHLPMQTKQVNDKVSFLSKPELPSCL